MKFFKGDVVCTDFDPSKGHEQNKRRYAVVLSNDDYNSRCTLTMICPITSTDNGYPLHVDITDTRMDIAPTRRNEVSGFAEVEQLKALDLNARNTDYVGKLSDRKVRQLTQAALSCIM